ncbi:MAG: DUF1361 domain-containing protein [Cytophagales bacterium]|nr:MAG: DUF1361 domain-containing protein [Cytophagales bacterium]
MNMTQHLSLKRLNIPLFLQTIFPAFCVSTFASLMLFFRLYKSWQHDAWYLAFGWNLFLAWVPLFISIWLQWKHQQQKLSKITLLFFLGCWLLFLPNSPYIITDLLHIRHRGIGSVPIWFDTLFFFTFALAGLQAGMFSLYFVQKLLNHYFNEKLVWVFVIAVLLLTGFGMYLGRELRWNSWDIISQPLALSYVIINQLFNIVALQFTFTYFVAMKIFYLMFIYQREMR